MSKSARFRRPQLLSSIASGIFLGLLAFLISCGGDAISEAAGDSADSSVADDSAGLRYLEEELLPAPLLPGNLDDLGIGCALDSQAADDHYRSAAEVDYSKPGWESRIASDWTFFDTPPGEGWLTVIDFRQQSGELAYRYLANAETHDRLYEPWSSSKIQAFTAAVARLRPHGIGAGASVGGVLLSDLITSINSYAPSGDTDGNSNAIAG